MVRPRRVAVVAHEARVGVALADGVLVHVERVVGGAALDDLSREVVGRDVRVAPDAPARQPVPPPVALAKLMIVEGIRGPDGEHVADAVIVVHAKWPGVVGSAFVDPAIVVRRVREEDVQLAVGVDAHHGHESALVGAERDARAVAASQEVVGLGEPHANFAVVLLLDGGRGDAGEWLDVAIAAERGEERKNAEKDRGVHDCSGVRVVGMVTHEPGHGPCPRAR
jgi:hypothetical protein